MFSFFTHSVCVCLWCIYEGKYVTSTCVEVKEQLYTIYSFPLRYFTFLFFSFLRLLFNYNTSPLLFLPSNMCVCMCVYIFLSTRFQIHWLFILCYFVLIFIACLCMYISTCIMINICYLYI
ncbi:mCG148213 [Mus musculus]|nr:mCG148213 [Mus musculus]